MDIEQAKKYAANLLSAQMIVPNESPKPIITMLRQDKVTNDAMPLITALQYLCDREGDELRLLLQSKEFRRAIEASVADEQVGYDEIVGIIAFHGRQKNGDLDLNGHQRLFSSVTAHALLMFDLSNLCCSLDITPISKSELQDRWNPEVKVRTAY